MAKIMLATGLIVAYGYFMEAFMAWYSGNQYDLYVDRQSRPGAVLAGLLGPVGVQRCRAASAVVQACSIESDAAVRRRGHRAGRHVAGAIRDYRHQPAPRFFAVVVGHVLADILGLGHASSARSACSSALLFLFLRFLPMISISEMRMLLPEAQAEHAGEIKSEITKSH